MVLEFFIWLAAMFLSLFAWLHTFPSVKHPHSKQTTCIRACIWSVVLVSIAAATVFADRSFFFAIIVGYAFTAAVLLFNFAKDRKEKLKDFWDRNIVPCYPLFIIVLIVVCSLFAYNEKHLVAQLEEREKEGWDAGYASGYDDGVDKGYGEAESEYSGDYDSGYEDGFSDGVDYVYSECEKEIADSREATFDDGYLCGYEDASQGLEYGTNSFRNAFSDNQDNS